MKLQRKLPLVVITLLSSLMLAACGNSSSIKQASCSKVCSCKVFKN